jgi:hypothetical protein
MKKIILFLSIIITNQALAESYNNQTQHSTTTRLDSTVYNNGSEAYIAGKYQKSYYTYNTANQIIKKDIYQINSSTNKYDLYTSSHYSYNTNGQKKQDSIITYNSGSSWINIIKYDYNSNNLIQYKTNFTKNTAISLPYYAEKTSYLYNSNVLRQEDNTDWNSSTNIWRTTGKVIHYVDQNNNDTLTKYYSLNNTKLCLSQYITNKITYQSGSKKLSKIKQSFDISINDSNSVLSIDKFESTYDSNGNIITNYRAYKTSTSTSFSPQYLFIFTYDTNSLYCESEGLTSVYLDEITNRLTKLQVYQFYASNYYPQAIMSLYYSNAITTDLSSTNTETSTAKVFYFNNSIIINNTATDVTRFQLSVYDINGKRIISNAEINSQNNISLPNLPKGIYAYTLTTDTQHFNGKFIVK